MNETMNKLETVYFNSGCVRSRDFIYMVSKLDNVDPNEMTLSRYFHYYHDEKETDWGFMDFTWNISSICCIEPKGYAILSADGDVRISRPDYKNNENISDNVSIKGGFYDIQYIGNHLYAVSLAGDVVRREDEGWKSFKQGIGEKSRHGHRLRFTAIYGVSEQDLYLVGFNGVVFHYDGTQWEEIETPTTLNLERVHCVSEEEVYICGKNGTLLKGNYKDGFVDYAVEGFEDGFWGLTYYNGKAYMATLRGLYEFDGEVITPVQTDLRYDITTYRLDARDGVMWSFGPKHLVRFDGESWQELYHPDNHPDKVHYIQGASD